MGSLLVISIYLITSSEAKVLEACVRMGPIFSSGKAGGTPKNFFEKYSYITVYEPEAKGGCLQFSQLG